VTTALAALAAAAITTGLMMIVAGWRTPVPDLRQAITRLTSRPTPTPPVTAEATGSRWSTRALADRLTHTHPDLTDLALVRALRLPRLAGDLRLLGEGLDILIIRKIVGLVAGLALPPVLAGCLTTVGIHLPWTIPTLACLAIGAVTATIPDLDIRSRAATARTELRRAVCVYIDLVALERAADAGVTQALDRAAAISDTPAFTAIRTALTDARLDGRPAWDALHTLADTTGITELNDLADIMATSGQHGAAVYTSLRARAASLRTALAAENATQAHAASERMTIPATLLGVIFMALVAYPALARITHP
jgi:Flp pilus assembly protein TadB